MLWGFVSGTVVSLTSNLCLAQRFLFNINFIKALLSKTVTLLGCGITLSTRMWKLIIFSWGRCEGLREAEEKGSKGWEVAWVHFPVEWS